ncbi:hypothetical protein DOY81_013941 [Sarcophaga bullata]|nr:hypothetical protein DOY81_013941 [Sarcophaga bullata]
MRFLLVLAFATVALAGTVRMGRQPMSDRIDAYVLDLLENNGEIEMAVDHEEGTVEIAPQFIVSWQVRRFIRKLQKQMPCGWPQYGIPALAPYKIREGEFSYDLGVLKTIDKVVRFLVEGLDDFKIQKFKLNVITSKVTFDFMFQNINISADKYETDTILNLMRQLGLSVQYEGDGSLEFGLKNLRIAGVLRYKIPILWGSIKITSLKTEFSLDECTSDITGILGDGNLNQMINRQLESAVVFNDNSQHDIGLH